MDFQTFKRQVGHELQVNLEGYKETQLKRRIDSLMSVLGLASYEEYLERLRRDKAQRQRFLDKITINVSEFFRNPDSFAYLEKHVLPVLLRKWSRLKVWSAGCANGAEPYSIAISLQEVAGPHIRHQIEATDIDDKILGVAKAGIYDESSLKNVPESRLKKYFTANGNQYAINAQVKAMVSFRHHNLLTDPYGSDYHLIVCRNVTIYFTRETQEELYRKFSLALAPGGVLFTGATETIWQYRDLGLGKLSPWFYFRPPWETN